METNENAVVTKLTDVQIVELISSSLPEENKIKEVISPRKGTTNIRFNGGNIEIDPKRGMYILSVDKYFRNMRLFDVKILCENFKLIITPPSTLEELRELIIILTTKHTYEEMTIGEIEKSPEDSYFVIELPGESEIMVGDGLLKHGVDAIRDLLVMIAHYGHKKFKANEENNLLLSNDKLYKLTELGYGNTNRITVSNIGELFFTVKDKSVVILLCIGKLYKGEMHSFEAKIEDIQEPDLDLLCDFNNADNVLRGLLKMCNIYEFSGESLIYQDVYYKTDSLAKLVSRIENNKKENRLF